MTSPSNHVLDRVDDYLHDLLFPIEAHSFERHCAACPSCNAALEEARKRLAALQAVPVSEASEEMVQTTMNHIDAYEKRQRKLRRYVVSYILWGIAASVALLAGVQYHYANLTASPFDLKVLGQTRLFPGAAASLRVYLMDRVGGVVLAGVPIEIALGRKGTGQTTLARFTTDAQGTGQPQFQVPEWADGDCELQITAQLPGGTESLTQQVQLKRSWQVMLSSDKPVYQPGQTIHVRSLALRRPDLKPVAAQEATFTVSDPKGNVIFKHQGPTSLYGIASIDCPLANEILEGPYVLACRVGDTESRLTVEVKKYVLPNFKVDVTLDRSYYAPGQKLQATIQAAYFFGQPVAEGTVELEVVGRDVGPQVLHRSNGRTDASGKAVFSCPLPESLVGRPQDNDDARVSVQVAVTDSAGQKQSKTTSTVVTSQPLRLEVLPECGGLVRGISTRVYVFTSYADGQPARATVEVPGRREKVVTNELGVGSFDFTANDSYGITGDFRVTDEKGTAVLQKKMELSCGNYGPDFLLRIDKAVYRGGDTMILTALGGGQDPVFVDVIKDGQTLLTETINLTNGRGEYHLDLPPELSGTVQLCAYRFDAGGVPVRKTRDFLHPPGRRPGGENDAQPGGVSSGRQGSSAAGAARPERPPGSWCPEPGGRGRGRLRRAGTGARHGEKLLHAGR